MTTGRVINCARFLKWGLTSSSAGSIRRLRISLNGKFLDKWIVKQSLVNTGCYFVFRQGLKRKIDEPVEPSVEVVDQPIIVQPLRGGSDPYALHKALYKMRPRFIIMYDCDIAFVRQVEVYQATHKEDAVRVYFLIYDASAEEQAYLTNLRREKEAFEMLIREKAVTFLSCVIVNDNLLLKFELL